MLRVSMQFCVNEIFMSNMNFFFFSDERIDG